MHRWAACAGGRRGPAGRAVAGCIWRGRWPSPLRQRFSLLPYAAATTNAIVATTTAAAAEEA
jgi:hypothetical protein